MKSSQRSFKSRLILVLVLAGTIPLLAANLVAYWKASSEITHLAEEHATAVGSKKSALIENYFTNEADSLADLAGAPSTRLALLQFNKAFQEYEQDELTRDQAAKVDEFYNTTFNEAYAKKTTLKSFQPLSVIQSLSHRSRLAQYDFIANNSHPLGEKDKLVKPERKSSYAQVHQVFHTDFRNHLLRNALYDIFLVNAQGDVVYTVFKENDFASSLVNGAWSKSGLARAFEASKTLKSGEVYMEDFATYTPSYEAPASFMASAIYYEDKYLGSVLVQLPLDKITAIASDREGFDTDDEVVLLGSDLKLRADTFRNKDKYNVAASFAENSQLSFEMEAIKHLKTGKKGVIKQISYDGLPTLAYYQPIKAHNLTWYSVTELSQANIYAGLRTLNKLLIAIVALAIASISAFAWFFGGGIARNLQTIIANLSDNSQKVSSASQLSASSSTELSEAATEQAASLQETMASVEEISAMVNQNADSATKVQGAVQLNQQASEEGSQSVAEMLGAIDEIKSTNDQILSQMETSNKEFAEIVKIISEIGDKTKVINDIVFQTKLLSFNASVEAARAGEHGKGFAVVAEEVGNLAQMSGNAAKQITDMLTNSIKKVNDIVDQSTHRIDQLVEVGKDKISMGQSTAQKCQQALEKISTNARSVVTMIAEITNASKEQAQGIQEINKAISQLDQVTQQNSAVAQQASTQAEQLSAEASSLSNAVHTLVNFVEGSAHNTDTETEAVQPTNAVALTPKTSSLISDRVLDFNQAKAKKISLAERQERNQVTQIAAGSENTPVAEKIPSSDDPNFNEEF